jgi:predicted  nucleic acid-binding Zn-ribbon protein
VWVVGGIMALITTLLGWVGRRYIRHRDDQIDSLRSDIQEIRDQMSTEHEGVEDRVARIDDKIDQIAEQL